MKYKQPKEYSVDLESAGYPETNTKPFGSNSRVIPVVTKKARGGGAAQRGTSFTEQVVKKIGKY